LIVALTGDEMRVNKALRLKNEPLDIIFPLFECSGKMGRS